MPSANYVIIDGQAYSPKHRKVIALLRQSPQNVSNPLEGVHTTPKPSKRLKQRSAPVMNKLEQEFYERHRDQYPFNPPMRPQAIRFSLGNGVSFTPDFFSFMWPYRVLKDGNLVEGPDMPTACEVKGKHAWDDAIVKLKVAARIYPEIRWFLVWKDATGWNHQLILP